MTPELLANYNITINLKNSAVEQKDSDDEERDFDIVAVHNKQDNHLIF